MNLEYKKKIETLETSLKQVQEQNSNLSLEKETLAKDINCYKERIVHLDAANSKLKKDNDKLLKILNNIEKDSKSQTEQKTAEFQGFFIDFENKQKLLDQEVK